MTVVNLDCIFGMKLTPDNSVDAIVTDPPYELGFMGKSWDSTGIAYNVEMWRHALRVLKPGGHLLAFSGSRTYHRMVCAIEDAGFEIRDQIMWVYGSGFPKSLDVSKAIDKAAGAVREQTGVSYRPEGRAFAEGGSGFAKGETILKDKPATEDAAKWQGWGTALKPAHEPIVVARKPLVGTVAANVLEYGTGALNIDASRIGHEKIESGRAGRGPNGGGWGMSGEETQRWQTGRWPANVIHDGSVEVLAAFPDAIELEKSAARFFYCAKASKDDRGEGNIHPTVKPSDLMRYLVRLVTPPGGTVLDPFTGSGSTGVAAVSQGFKFIGFESDIEHGYAEIAQRRIDAARLNTY